MRETEITMGKGRSMRLYGLPLNPVVEVFLLRSVSDSPGENTALRHLPFHPLVENKNALLLSNPMLATQLLLETARQAATNL